MKCMILMMGLGGFMVGSLAKPFPAFGGDRKLPWSRDVIKWQRDQFVDLITENNEKIDNWERLLGIKNNWDDCHKIYDNALRNGLMTSEDVDDWKNEKVAPRFKDGEFKGIALQCGCFHPKSMIDVFDPISGNRLQLSAANVVERRGEIALIHLDREATADHFVGSYSPIKMTTHGREFFDLVVIRVADGRMLKLTREHGVFVFPGLVKQARNVNLSDKLYDRDGSLINVVSLGSEAIEDEVVNFETNPGIFRGNEGEDHPLEHIIFASGLAVGDLSWQNRFGSRLGKILW